MTVKDYLNTYENGSRHILLYDKNGEILGETIWKNEIPEQYLNREILNVDAFEYELRIEI